MPHRFRVVAFDLDEASLIRLKEAFPEWVVEVVNGATAASLAHDWNPGRADLLVVRAREEAVETLGLCRFLVRCGAFSTDARGQLPNQVGRADAPLFVLVPEGREPLVRAAFEAGADHCLDLPIQARDLTSALARVRQGQLKASIGRECEDRWRDDGGQG
jgi:CheY-like chemotaxis protein